MNTNGTRVIDFGAGCRSGVRDRKIGGGSKLSVTGLISALEADVSTGGEAMEPTVWFG